MAEPETPAAVAQALALFVAGVETWRLRAMERAARFLERKAKAAIGHYQEGAGELMEWAPLKWSTVEEKERLGYAPPDNPLLRTGEMRASIGHHVESADRAVVGSESEVLLAHELGTKHLPPRSVLGLAALHHADRIVEILGRPFGAHLTERDDEGTETSYGIR